jgi:hypothetical protein
MVAHGSQTTDTIVYHRFYERDDPGQRGFRTLSDLVIDTTSYGTGSGYATASAELTTADSVIAIGMEWFFPQESVYADFVILRYTVSNRTAVPINDAVIGLWLDLDAVAGDHMLRLQDGIGNHGDYFSAANLLYQYGYDTVAHVPSSHLNSTQRYSGGISYLAGRDALGDTFSLRSVPMRAGIDDNRQNQPDGGPASGFLYGILTGNPVVDVWEPPPHPDSSKDLYTWVTLDVGRTLEADGASSEVYVVALVSDTLQNPAYPMAAKVLDGGLSETVDSAWAWASRNVLCRCVHHGDPVPDGELELLDVVQAINVAFRNFDPMFDSDCPYERSDVDCDHETGLLDVVKMINVAFRNFEQETQFCDGCAD